MLKDWSALYFLLLLLLFLSFETKIADEKDYHKLKHLCHLHHHPSVHLLSRLSFCCKSNVMSDCFLYRIHKNLVLNEAINLIWDWNHTLSSWPDRLEVRILAFDTCIIPFLTFFIFLGSSLLHLISCFLSDLKHLQVRLDPCLIFFLYSSSFDTRLTFFYCCCCCQQASESEDHVSHQLQSLREQFNVRRSNLHDHVAQLEGLREEVSPCLVLSHS